MTALRVLGIDPGLRVTGYGVVEQRGSRMYLVEAGIVAPDVRGPLEVRLRQLHDGIRTVLAATSPACIVIEELYTTYKNPMTAILMAHARGVLALAGAQSGLPVRTLGHSLVKRALIGSGSARKEQVGAMVTQLLRLQRAPEPNDVSDALALAIAFLNVHEHEARLASALELARGAS